MKALILDSQIVEVVQESFPVAPALTWIDCPEVCTTAWTYVDGQFVEPQPAVATSEQNKAQASQLLLDCDWVNQPDVVDTTVNPHLLNKADFDVYRQELRVIAVYPTSGNLTWPVKPQSQWSAV